MTGCHEAGTEGSANVYIIIPHGEEFLGDAEEALVGYIDRRPPPALFVSIYLPALPTPLCLHCGCMCTEHQQVTRYATLGKVIDITTPLFILPITFFTLNVKPSLERRKENVEAPVDFFSTYVYMRKKN